MGTATPVKLAAREIFHKGVPSESASDDSQGRTHRPAMGLPACGARKREDKYSDNRRSGTINAHHNYKDLPTNAKMIHTWRPPAMRNNYNFSIDTGCTVRACRC